MSAGTYDIYFEQGATFNRVLTWQDPSGTPINLTSYSARMQVRTRKSATDVLLSLTTANGRITLGGIAGTIALNVDAVTSAAMSAGNFVYDLELVSAGGEVTRLLEGEFICSAEVTR